MPVSVHRNLASLPDAFDVLLDDGPGRSVFHSRAWLENFAAHGLTPGDRLRIYALAEGDDLALLVGVRSRLYSLHPKARVLYFLQPDGLEFTPLMTPGTHTPQEVFSRVIDFVRSDTSPYDVVRFGPLDPESPVFAHVIGRLRRRGFLVQTYFNYPNWHADVAGMSSEDYLRARSRDFRRSIRRRNRRLDERGGVRFELVTGGERVDGAIADYERVFAARAPNLQEEPAPPGYIPSAIRCAARAGALRLGLLHVDGRPAAYQFCIVSAGAAHFIRTGYDLGLRKLSVGKSVIFRVLEHVLDVDRVGHLDFGIGDHLYKSDWVHQRRERWGIAAYNPRTVRGLRNAAVHILGRRAKPALKRLRDRVVSWLP